MHSLCNIISPSWRQLSSLGAQVKSIATITTNREKTTAVAPCCVRHHILITRKSPSRLQGYALLCAVVINYQHPFSVLINVFHHTQLSAGQHFTQVAQTYTLTLFHLCWKRLCKPRHSPPSAVEPRENKMVR